MIFFFHRSRPQTPELPAEKARSGRGLNPRPPATPDRRSRNGANQAAVNRPFPSSKKSHFQSEAKCEAIDMKMIFNYDANKIYFHNKGFALSLVLKVRFFGTRKWPIGYDDSESHSSKVVSF